MASARGQLGSILRRLVDHPEAVEVRAAVGERATRLSVSVDEEDLGVVIGRHGRTARALRSLLDLRGAREGRGYELRILDERD